jgi:hypothetical protein
MTRLLGEPVTVLRATDNWQRYQAGRHMPMYGGTYDWHTLEGAFVVRSPEGQDYVAYHAWDEPGERRLLHVDPLNWTEDDRPVIG